MTRDRFARVESNYRNKLNRYARRVHPLAYLFAYATPVRHGTTVEAWQAAWIRTIQRFIAFEQFVHGLTRDGFDRDPHFASQVKVPVSVTRDASLRITRVRCVLPRYKAANWVRPGTRAKAQAAGCQRHRLAFPI